jgi:hypothetical protein
MRHIPEDELHAYLDQGLSRTQCVEIESHLADCPSCRATRDGIAALRDRTTALLSRLAPPRGFPPAFAVLRERAAAAADQRRRRIQVGAWAASLVAAVGIGWGASSAVQTAETRTRPALPVAVAPAPPPRTTAAGPATRDDVPAQRASLRKPSDTTGRRHPVPAHAPAPARAAIRLAAAQDSADSVAERRAATLSVLDPVPALKLTPLERPASPSDLELGGMWRTMSWDGAKAEAGERVPHIDGLPVVQVQVQNGEQGARQVMVVAQQLASGQVIRTIEGPATDVSQLLSRRSIADVDSVLLPGDSGAAGDANHAMAMQVGDRMLAITGNLPSDSLRAMIRRLNAEMRTK